MTGHERERDLPYEAIPHTGDLAFHVRGRDLPELFLNAARALFAAMSVPPQTTTVTREISLTAADPESLLVDWLNALIYLHETEGETYSVFTLDAFTPTHLAARVSGGPTSETTLVVKAATYHDLHITSTDAGVDATIVFDI